MFHAAKSRRTKLMINTQPVAVIRVRMRALERDLMWECLGTVHSGFWILDSGLMPPKGNHLPLPARVCSSGGTSSIERLRKTCLCAAAVVWLRLRPRSAIQNLKSKIQNQTGIGMLLTTSARVRARSRAAETRSPPRLFTSSRCDRTATAMCLTSPGVTKSRPSTSALAWQAS